MTLKWNCLGPPLERPRSDTCPCLFSTFEDPAGGGRGPEPDWSCEEDISLFFYPIVLCMHFSPNFLPPHRVCEWVWVWVCLKMPGFRGNVSLAALKCLPYFISSKPSVNTLLGFIWSIVWRGMAKPLLGWLHCVCALVPRRKSRALSHYGPRVERNHYLILFGFSVYIVYVKDKEVLIYNI